MLQIYNWSLNFAPEESLIHVFDAQVFQGICEGLAEKTSSFIVWIVQAKISV